MAELKYKLAQAEAKADRVDKENRKIKYQLKEKQQENERLSNDLVEISKLVDEKTATSLKLKEKSDGTVASLKELNNKAEQIVSRNQALIEIIKSK